MRALFTLLFMALLVPASLAAYFLPRLVLHHKGTYRRGKLLLNDNPGFSVWLPGWWPLSTPAGIKDAANLQAPGQLHYYAQDLEDQYAQKTFFKGKQQGIYLEMGALDGLRFSNTMHFHQDYGWKGILIEPSPEIFASLKVNRPNDVCINLAACSHAQLVHFVDNGNPAVSGIYEFMQPSFRKEWHPGVTSSNLARLPAVSCQPLTPIFGKLGFQHIDFFSLDVEGAELEVLQTFPFGHISIGVIVIEADGHNASKDNAVKQLLVDHGYTYHDHIVRNDWFFNASYIAAL